MDLRCIKEAKAFEVVILPSHRIHTFYQPTGGTVVMQQSERARTQPLP